jgi:hypothetical protein
MSVLAICSSITCNYRLKLQDPVCGLSIPTPPRCPNCLAPVITACPGCGFPLLEPLNPASRCEVCHADLRRPHVQARN